VNPLVGKMFAYTSGGKTSIALGEYDAFLLAGLGFGIDLARMFSRCNVVEHLAQGRTDAVVSHACLVEIIKAHNAKSAALKFAKEIRADSSKPILIYPTPFRPESSVPGWNDPCLTNQALLENIMPRSMAATSKLASEHGCEVFWQHPATVSLPGLTKARFAKGAVNLRASLENQSKHVNPDFAVLSLQAILWRLDQAAPGRVLDRTHDANAELRVSA
jgi:hypothetical protein